MTHALASAARRACLMVWCLVNVLSAARAADEPAGPLTVLPARIAVSVTGAPASPGFIIGQIDAAIARAAGDLPGGTIVRPIAIAPAPQPLDRGFATSFRVDVQIDPGNGAVAPASTIVDVANADVPSFAPRTLAFRDDPEKIGADGVLSRTTVEIGDPTRVYYYHQNVGQRRRFCVVLSSNDSVRTDVQLISATAGPNVDVMSVGHAATKTFLARKPHNEGSVVTIAGGKPALARDETAGPGEVLVGAVDLRILDGGPLTVTVMAIEPGADPAAYLYTPKLADDGHGRHGTFDLTGFGERIVAYTVGGPDAAHVYGKRQTTLVNRDPADPGRDYGDYGVVQRVSFDLANPTAEPATLYLYEKPLGGVVRSSFLVDGEPVDVGCVRVAQRYMVRPYVLAARSTATLDVVTMTDGGSNYPLEIGVTGSAPNATTPPIAAPDGCFPKPSK